MRPAWTAKWRPLAWRCLPRSPCAEVRIDLDLGVLWVPVPQALCYVYEAYRVVMAGDREEP